MNSAKTRASIARYQKQYHELHKEVKIRVRQDKRCYYEELAQEAEEAAERRDLRELYHLTRVMAGKNPRPERPIKDKSGKTLSSKEEQQKRWVEHFSELLNREPPSTMANIVRSRDCKV
mgnify:CR=1 FL=1